MKSYEVAIPFTGAYYVTVDAVSKEEALALGFAMAEKELEFVDTVDMLGFSEMELVESVTRGNVFSGVLNDAYVEESR